MLFRTLRRAGLLEVGTSFTTGKAEIRVNTDLQEDFSLLHTLSLYLVEALGLLLSLVESVLESPRVILMKQVDKLKSERYAAMRAEGLEYDERMAELEKIEHPKPNADFIYQTFNQFAAQHPWVGSENIRPKSIVGEMYERCASFNDYVGEYGLQRSEGVLLRYLSHCYKTLVQSVPEVRKSDGVVDIIAYLRTTLARTDTSLVEEWESLLAPADPDEAPTGAARARRIDPDADPRAFRARCRQEVHAVVRALAQGDYEGACAALRPDADDPWTVERLASALAPFLNEYERIVFDPRARLPHLTHLTPLEPQLWQIRQVLVDPAEDNLWMLEGEIDLGTLEDPETPWIRLVRIGC